MVVDAGERPVASRRELQQQPRQRRVAGRGVPLGVLALVEMLVGHDRLRDELATIGTCNQRNDTPGTDQINTSTRASD